MNFASPQAVTIRMQRSQKDSTINEHIAVIMRTSVVLCQQGVGCSPIQTDDYTSALTFIPLLLSVICSLRLSSQLVQTKLF